MNKLIEVPVSKLQQLQFAHQSHFNTISVTIAAPLRCRARYASVPPLPRVHRPQCALTTSAAPFRRRHSADQWRKPAPHCCCSCYCCCCWWYRHDISRSRRASHRPSADSGAAAPPVGKRSEHCSSKQKIGGEPVPGRSGRRPAGSTRSPPAGPAAAAWAGTALQSLSVRTRHCDHRLYCCYCCYYYCCYNYRLPLSHRCCVCAPARRRTRRAAGPPACCRCPPRVCAAPLSREPGAAPAAQGRSLLGRCCLRRVRQLLCPCRHHC